MQYMCFDVQGGHWELVPFSSLGFVNCAVNGDWTGEIFVLARGAGNQLGRGPRAGHRRSVPER